MKKIIKISVIILIILLLAAALIFSAVTVSGAFKVADPQRKMLISDPSSEGLWFDSFETESENGTVRGWYIPAQKSENEISESDKTIITSHNYGDNREMNDISFMSLLKFLVRNGYNIVTFDYTGSGTSDGKNYTFGQKEEIEDLTAVVNYVRNEFPEDKIALYGWAFGAAAALSAADSCGVDIVIADSSYTDLSSLLDSSMHNFTGNKNGFYNACVKMLLPLVSSVDYGFESPLSAVEKASGKFYLFIHGQADSIIPCENSEKLYSAAKDSNTAEIYTVPKSAHIYGFMESGTNYEQVLLAFLEKAFA